METLSPWFLDTHSFHIEDPLRGLRHMIKAFSLKLSSQARERLAWMDTYRECGNAMLVCRKFGISECTFWRWRKRYDPWDLTSLESHSRRPKHSPKKTGRQVEQLILHTKQTHVRWGKEKIALYLRKQGVSISGKTVWKILKRHQQIIRYKTRKRKSPKPRLNWAGVRLPGDVLQMDTKYVNLHGRRVCQYTIIDVVSRWRHAEIYPEMTGASTIAFLTHVKNKITFPIHTIQTDNGHEFQKVVTAWLKRHGIRHVFTHKGRPTENGHVERSHRTDEEEFYSLGGYGSTLTELRSNFAAYLNMYNTKRPRWSLKGQTPVEALESYLPKHCQMS